MSTRRDLLAGAGVGCCMIRYPGRAVAMVGVRRSRVPVRCGRREVALCVYAREIQVRSSYCRCAAHPGRSLLVRGVMEISSLLVKGVVELGAGWLPSLHAQRHGFNTDFVAAARLQNSEYGVAMILFSYLTFS